MEFNSVDMPTVTVVLQYPKISEMYVCKVSFEKDIDLALLQATFAIKDQIKQDSNKKLSDLYNEVLDGILQEKVLKKGLDDDDPF